MYLGTAISGTTWCVNIFSQLSNYLTFLNCSYIHNCNLNKNIKACIDNFELVLRVVIYMYLLILCTSTYKFALYFHNQIRCVNNEERNFVFGFAPKFNQICLHQKLALLICDFLYLCSVLAKMSPTLENVWTNQQLLLDKSYEERSNVQNLAKKVAEIELREDKHTREQCLIQLRQWIKKNPDIQNCILGKHVLLCYEQLIILPNRRFFPVALFTSEKV